MRRFKSPSGPDHAARFALVCIGTVLGTAIIFLLAGADASVWLRGGMSLGAVLAAGVIWYEYLRAFPRRKNE